MEGGEGYSSEQWEIIKERISRILARHPAYPGTTTWYVDQVAGSDIIGNGTEDNPYQTITKAANEAGPRDTIIAWGTFSEDIILDNVGLRLFGLGQHNGLTIIQGAANLTSKIITDANGIEVAELEVDGSIYTGHGIEIQDSSYPNIHHNLIRNITGPYDAIDKSSGANTNRGKIEDNIIVDGAGTGIGLVNFLYGIISRNKILRMGGDGININAICGYNTLEKNKCLSNVGNGIRIDGDNNELINNLMRGNTAAQWVDNGTNNNWVGLYELHKDLMKPYYLPADGGIATVTGDGAANAFGPWIQITASLGSDSWMTGLEGELDNVDKYTIEIGIGTNPIAEFKFEAQATDTSINIGCSERFIPEGSQVQIRLKTVGGGSATLTDSSIRLKSK